MRGWKVKVPPTPELVCWPLLLTATRIDDGQCSGLVHVIADDDIQVAGVLLPETEVDSVPVLAAKK
jgi:hypothetical protein